MKTSANPLHGLLPSEIDPRPNHGVLRELYAAMLRIRMIEETIADRYKEQEMRCPVHLSSGQEAIAVGVCTVLRQTDQIVSTHRCHAHYLAKGGDLKAMLAEIYGRAAGSCGGRGGSMHLFDNNVGMLVSLPIVASSIPIGVGAAMTMKARGRDGVAVVFLGDASTEEGVFHESMNFAAVRKLPVVFISENNLYSVYTPLRVRQPQREIVDLARAHGVPGVRGDGMNALQVRDLASAAVRRARNGDGPTFLVLDTYRWREHCGPNYDNDAGYRTEGEYLDWRSRDPVATLRLRLLAEGIMTAEEDAIRARAIQSEIDQAFAFARSAPYPDPATATRGVYA